MSANDTNQGHNSEVAAVQTALRNAGQYIHQLPAQERRIAALAARGVPAWEIAQAERISDAAVRRTILSVVHAVSGDTFPSFETGGFGSDTAGSAEDTPWGNDAKRR